jgi:pimeloyl-ACP methyl ester carboxylesterase
MDNFVSGNGIHIYVERCGRGEPLLMIPGLGAGAWLWMKSVNALSQHFELIMPELRGSGRSDKPDHRYSIKLFALDVKSLLEHLEIPKLHILGVSMGGLVAQYFAANWPERVKKIVLAATSLGGQSQIGPDGEVLSRMIRPRGRTKRERLEDSYSLNFTREYMTQHSQELERITEWRTQYPQPEFAYYRQLLAGNAYDGEVIAHKITSRTLIFAGEQDELVPLQDVYALKDKIPNARLVIFQGKHLFFFEHSRKFNNAVIEFLKDETESAMEQKEASTESN